MQATIPISKARAMSTAKHTLLSSVITASWVLVLLSSQLSAQFAITSPTGSPTISGTYPLTVGSVPVGTYEVDYYANTTASYDNLLGVSRSAPWSFSWNTFNHYNSSASWETMYAVAVGADGTVLGTTAGQPFEVYNAYLVPSSTIGCGTITTSTALTSNWAGTVTISVPFTGTGASDSKSTWIYIDGDWARGATSVTNTANPVTFSVNTTLFPNGSHVIFITSRDRTNYMNVQGGYPFCQWEQQITFANGTAPMELLVSPQEWFIAPGMTQQLSPIIDNTDGTTSAATGVTYTHTGGPCTVNSSGLATATSGSTTYGNCVVTVTATNGAGFTRINNGYVSILNAVPHFDTDGQIHNTDDGTANLWFASIFQSTPYGYFADPTITSAQTGTALNKAGYNTYESGPVTQNATTGFFGTTFAQFQANVTSALASAPFSTYGLYVHAAAGPMMSTGYSTCGTSSGCLYQSTRGVCSGYSTACWTYWVQQWAAAGLLLGVTTLDEAGNNYSYPNVLTGVVGSTNGATSITCPGGGSTTWTINYTYPPSPPWNGPHKFIITGDVSGAGLNNTIGGSFYTGVVTNTTVTFTGPACATSYNITSGPTVESFAFQWENSNTDYVHNTDFASISTLVHAGGSRGLLTGPAAGVNGPIQQAGWMGGCTSPASWGDFGEFYASQDDVTYSNPMHGWESTLLRTGSDNLADNFRTMWGICVPRGCFSGSPTQRCSTMAFSPGFFQSPALLVRLSLSQRHMGSVLFIRECRAERSLVRLIPISMGMWPSQVVLRPALVKSPFRLPLPARRIQVLALSLFRTDLPSPT